VKAEGGDRTERKRKEMLDEWRRGKERKRFCIFIPDLFCTIYIILLA
jgi:hypothetical protein